MSIHHDEPFDPCKPALIVTVGNTARKHRALDRDVVLLGRAHGCDIGLSAADISSVHCLIYRSPEGLCIRDCQSRSGTHVNGVAIQERQLRDGDTIQVGPFSFQAYLPNSAPDSVPATPCPTNAATPSEPEGRTGLARLQHVERARRHLAELALSLRRQLQEARTTQQELAPLVERQAELDQQAGYLRGKAREYEQRARKLEEAERAVAADRAALEREAFAQQQRRQQEELELTQRQAALERLQEELRREREKQSREPAEGDSIPSLRLFLDELASHRNLTGCPLPLASSLGDTPLPDDWRELLKHLVTDGAKGTTAAAPPS